VNATSDGLAHKLLHLICHCLKQFDDNSFRTICFDSKASKLVRFNQLWGTAFRESSLDSFFAPRVDIDGQIHQYVEAVLWKGFHSSVN
jgi:hypothetical protein